MSDKYLNELKIHWEISNKHGLKFYGLTKCPETKEFMMIIQFADKGNLRRYCHKDFHSGNILLASATYISDFGLSGPANEQKSDGKVYGFWKNSIEGSYSVVEKFGYKGKEIKAAFEEADKEIPNISTSYEKNSDAVFTSRAFTFSNLLSKPVNSSIITSYINNEVCDSQLIDLEVSNSIQLRDIDDETAVTYCVTIGLIYVAIFLSYIVLH
ncbi:kinase-like domain-containing protein [Rhizophagus irregularis DAOM 181602=DAOM 197198]|nr:kinase-like domain-containing protein [Rhizophagus irregularis DAOM 181602=DAOM 197198]